MNDDTYKRWSWNSFEIDLLMIMFSFIPSSSRSIDLKVWINCSWSMTLELTTLYFRFALSTSELHLNVFDDKTEREKHFE